MNILVVIPYTPNKIRSRSYNFVRYLAARGNRVMLLTLHSNEMDQAAIRELEAEGIQVISYHLPAWRSLMNMASGMLTGDPLQSFYCWQPQLAQKLEELAGSGKFDAIHVEHLRGVRYAQDLLSKVGGPGRAGNKYPPVIWDSVDCISYLFQQSAEKSKKQVSRLITRFELNRTKGYEARMAQLFARTLVTSNLDKEAFSALLPGVPLGEKIAVLPNGVDLDYFQPPADGKRDPATLVISGKMSYHANVSMVMHLMENIMPHVWAKRPEVKLCIVGKDPPRDIRNLAKNDVVTVTGYVADIRPYLQRATVALAPLTYGAGIQNKVLEAMACATPVVATPKAVAALSTRSGQHLFVEQDPEAYARQVLKLVDNPLLAGQIGRAGRDYVEKYHDWSAIAGQLEQFYTEASMPG